jgi:hypothetical protein
MVFCWRLAIPSENFSFLFGIIRMKGYQLQRMHSCFYKEEHTCMPRLFIQSDLVAVVYILS